MSHDASVVPSRFLPPPGAISMRRSSVLLALLALVAGLVLAAPTATTAAPKAGGTGLEVFVGSLSPAQVDELAAAGLDHEDVRTGRLRDGEVPVEVVMSESLGRTLQSQGFDLR